MAGFADGEPRKISSPTTSSHIDPNFNKSPKMASTKRKGAVAFKSEEGNARKKPKKKEKPGKKSIKKFEVLETATDSDPIVESHTTSQSDEDDGTSWPSDDDAEPDQWAGVEEDNKTGLVQSAMEVIITDSERMAVTGAMNGTEQLISCVCS